MHFFRGALLPLVVLGWANNLPYTTDRWKDGSDFMTSTADAEGNNQMNSPNGQQCLAKTIINLNQSLTHVALKHFGNDGHYDTYFDVRNYTFLGNQHGY